MVQFRLFPNTSGTVFYCCRFHPGRTFRIGYSQEPGGGRLEIDAEGKAEREAIRQKVTVHGRGDLPRHFAVSAALTVLSDQHRSLAVGIAKEVSDSNPGGSGFSFVDMAANKAGIRFAVLATQDSKSALKMQSQMAQFVSANSFVSAIGSLPEGISADSFQAEYGGLGGRQTRRLMAEIDQLVDLLFDPDI